MQTKKTVYAGLTLIPALLLLIACGFTYGPKSTGDDSKKEERSVDTFSKIGFGIAADLYYTQEQTQKLVLEGSPKDLERIITEVKDGKLKIYTKSPFSGSMKSVKVYISSKELEEIGLSGSGNMIADGPVKSDVMSIALSGSGNIQFKNLVAKKVETALSGSGDINISGNGETESVEVAISGSGNIDLGHLKAVNVDVAISGSGNCKVNASGSLKCGISGSGDVSYSGNPQVNAKVSGSGRVSSN